MIRKGVPVTHATVTHYGAGLHAFAPLVQPCSDVRWYIKTCDADDQFVREIQVLAPSSAAAWSKAQRLMGDDERLMDDPTTLVALGGNSS